MRAHKYTRARAHTHTHTHTHTNTHTYDVLARAAVIVLNKIDLVTPEQLARVRAVVTNLNPGAKLIETSFARVDVRCACAL